MSEFTTKVAGVTEREADYFSQIPAKTLGGIIVRPPIHVGERFKSAILGRDKYLVNVEEVVTTSDETVLIAESGRHEGQAARIADIESIAERIARLAGSPEVVVRMIDENPFPMPEEFLR